MYLYTFECTENRFMYLYTSMVCTYTCEISLSQYFRLNSENT